MIVFFEIENDLFSPLNLHRPVSQLKVGLHSLFECFSLMKYHISSRVLGRELQGSWFSSNKSNQQTSVVFVNGFLVPNRENIEKINVFIKQFSAKKEWSLWNGERLVAMRLDVNTLLKLSNDFVVGKAVSKKSVSSRDTKTLSKSFLKIAKTINPRVEDKFKWLRYPHDIIVAGLSILRDDIFSRTKLIKSLKLSRSRKNNLFLGKNVKLSSYVDIDTSKGPVVIEDNTVVGSFVYLQGPLWIGQNCFVNHHSSLERAVLGNTVKVGGDVSDSIISDFTNKVHHGFLGHSYLGEWVNIGAGTTTANLKTTYRPVKYWNHIPQVVVTDELFLGAMISDQTKVGINTSLMPGVLIGFGASISGNIDCNINSFCNYSGHFSLNKNLKNSKNLSKNYVSFTSFKETQKKMFERRNFIPSISYWEHLQLIYQKALEKKSK